MRGCLLVVIVFVVGACARNAVPGGPELSAYREPADRIIAAALADDGAYRKLAELTDRVGARLSGSSALDKAVVWAGAAFRADGHENVRAEPVMVPHWVRGAESAAIVSPVERRLSILGLGGSSSTPDGGVEGGGHLDSWDVGQGAHDDGAGCVIMMQALTTLRKLGLRPRRTIRVVLFTNEENGQRGGKAYAAAHPEVHFAAIESDSGGFRPEGFSVEGDDAFVARVRAATALLGSLGATRVTKGMGGTDIAPLGERGVPLLGLDVEGSRYFDYHHSVADTLDKVDPKELAMNVATVAVVVYVLADLT